MDSSELERHLKPGKLAPVYLVLGPEPFLRSESVKMIRTAFSGKDAKFDLTELDASASDARALFEDLQVPSLFAARRLVIVDNAGPLFTLSPRMLVDYVNHPARGTLLVLVAEALGKTPKKAKKKRTASKKGVEEDESPDFLAEILTKVVRIDCAPVQPRMVKSWAAARAKAQGKILDFAAANLLVELGGSDLGPLDGHIEKLVAYCGDRPRITSDDVANLVGGGKAKNVWALTDAVSAGDAGAAMVVLNQLWRDGEIDASSALSLLAREVNRLSKVKTMLARGAKREEIAAILPRNQEWLAPKLADMARGVSAAELRARLHKILDADVSCKTGGAGGNDRWIIERTIMELCTAKRRTQNAERRMQK